MTIAIIDLGTNTFHCLIVQINDNGSYKILYKTKTQVKLGEGGINKKFIAPIPFRRGIVALRMFQETFKKYAVNKIFAFGTDALRTAKNTRDFITVAKQETDIDIQIISGDLEAEYIYYGVKQALNLGEERSLIMDIGGGSIEFMIANQKQIFWKKSYTIGAARLLEHFKPSDPITKDEITKIEKYLEDKLQSLFQAVKKFPANTLVGASGSFYTFFEMIAHRFFTPDIIKEKTEFEFSLDHFNIIHKELLSSIHQQRLQTKGIIPLRVDMIVLASILVDFIITRLNIRRMRLSSYALKEGILWEITQQLNFKTSGLGHA